MHDFENIMDREGNGSKKWNIDYINRRFPNCKRPYYPLFIADMDFNLPVEIRNEFIHFIEKGDFGYFDVLDNFYSSIANWYTNFKKIDISTEWILPGIGTLTSMDLTVKSLLNKDDSVLIFTPVYSPFRDIILNNNLNLVTQKLELLDNNYEIDFDLLEDNINKHNLKSILMCNPHNPSGRVWTFEELDKLVALCKKYNVLLISDEVHSDLVLSGYKFTSMIEFNEVYENIIITSSPNKTFNLAGLNASFLLVSNSLLREKIANTFSANKLGINRVGYEFLTACYENGESWVKDLVVNIQENIALVDAILNIDGINIIKPHSGYLLWMKFEGIKDTLKFVEDLAVSTGVLVESETRFVDSNDGYIRLNVATSQAILKDSMTKLVEFYSNYK